MKMLYRSKSHNGLGVFTDTEINSGEVVLPFRGRVVCRSELPAPYLEDRYVQIGDDLYLGPSGGLDDFVNHSCDPNCTLDVKNLQLAALRGIRPEEEITYDYSLTIKNDDWRIDCNCGSIKCRGSIGELR